MIKKVSEIALGPRYPVSKISMHGMQCSGEWSVQPGGRLVKNLRWWLGIQQEPRPTKPREPPEIRRAGGGNQAMSTPIRKGKVYLMGAGPGNPELLTLQAAQILKT